MSSPRRSFEWFESSLHPLFLSPMHQLKNSLNITLTEPVVFLRSSDPSGRHQTAPSDPPTLVRGILTLNVVKPIDISCIEVQLVGVSTINRPEGAGIHRIDVPEKRKIYSSSMTVFHACPVPHKVRPASVGPSLSTAHSNDGDQYTARVASPPPIDRRRHSERENVAVVPIDSTQTPPYSPATQSLTAFHSRPGSIGESPAQTLEELRQALRHNLEGQTYQNDSPHISPRLHPIALPLAATHSSTSSTSNHSLDQEHLSSDDMALTTSPAFEGDTSFHTITEEPLQILAHSTPSPIPRVRSSESTLGAQSHVRGNSCDASNRPTSRHRVRLSLSSVLTTVTDIASRTPSRPRSAIGLDDRERGRTRARILGGQQRTESIRGTVPRVGNGNQLGTDASDPHGHQEHHFPRLSRLLSFERNHEKSKDEHKRKGHGQGRREFKPGTYSYPISFLLPCNLPPTLSVPHGSLKYGIKAIAHRPGAFTSKLSCKVPVLVVAAPTVGDEEGIVGDPGPLLIQKQWEASLAYSIGLSSRLFLIGSQRHLEAAASADVGATTESLVEARAEASYGTAILELTLLPLEKIKIWKVNISIDQHVRYVDDQGKLLRDDDRRRVGLLEVKDSCPMEEMENGREQAQKHKERNKHDSVDIPLLPTPISPHRSPLLPYMPASTDPSVLVGPGPYTISTSIGLPDCNDLFYGDDGLRFSVKQKSSCIRVEHSLWVILRVERVGDQDNKRLFDITLHTPITILSCRCVPESQTLPRYSLSSGGDWVDRTACPCEPRIAGSGSAEQGYGDVGNPLAMRRITSPPSSMSSYAESDEGDTHYVHLGRDSDGHRPGHGHGHVRSPTQTPPLHLSRPASPIARYERLVSGLESEAGEAPPSYESVTSRPSTP